MGFGVRLFEDTNSRWKDYKVIFIPKNIQSSFHASKHVRVYNITSLGLVHAILLCSSIKSMQEIPEIDNVPSVSQNVC